MWAFVDAASSFKPMIIIVSRASTGVIKSGCAYQS